MMEPLATVLIVDDDVSLGTSVAEILRKQGFDAHFVSSGRDGFSLLEDRATKSLPNIDVIVCDLQMPEMTGDQFLSLLHQGPFRHAAFILASGSLTSEDVNTFSDLGVDGLLIKPFSTDVLLKEIDESRLRKANRRLKNQDFEI